MSVKSRSIAELYSAMVIEPMAHWWKPLHLQYYDQESAATFPGKSTSGAELGF